MTRFLTARARSGSCSAAALSPRVTRRASPLKLLDVEPYQTTAWRSAFSERHLLAGVISRFATPGHLVANSLPRLLAGSLLAGSLLAGSLLAGLPTTPPLIATSLARQLSPNWSRITDALE